MLSPRHPAGAPGRLMPEPPPKLPWHSDWRLREPRQGPPPRASLTGGLESGALRLCGVCSLSGFLFRPFDSWSPYSVGEGLTLSSPIPMADAPVSLLLRGSLPCRPARSFPARRGAAVSPGACTLQDCELGSAAPVSVDSQGAHVRASCVCLVHTLSRLHCCLSARTLLPHPTLL